MREELAPHVKEITRALEGNVDEELVARELDNYLTVYRVSLDTAKRSIVRKHGGNPAKLSSGGSYKAIKDLLPNEPSVNLLARVVTANPKEISRNGSTKTILYGLLEDDTGTVPYTAWEGRPDLRRGDIVRIENAYTKEWHERIELNIGSRATVVKEGEAEIAGPAAAPGSPTEVKVKDLREGMGNLGLNARILQVERREVEVQGQPKVVHSGLLADETGKAQFSAWGDFKHKVGDGIRIEGGYVRSWRGVPQISFDDRSRVTKLSDETLPSYEEVAQPQRVWIEDLARRGGAVDVTVRGVLIDVREGSGLVYRCPQCRRVVKKGLCRIHGEVQGEPDLRIKAVVDDGSGALTAIFNRDLTEALLGMDMGEAIEAAKEAMSQEAIRDKLADLLVAQPMEVRGNVTADEFGLMMIVTVAKLLHVDVEQEAKALLEELGVG